MTRTAPGRDGGAARTPEQAEPAAPVTLVRSREVRAGHEGAFEDALHRLAAEVRRQPGHIGSQPLKGAS